MVKRYRVGYHDYLNEDMITAKDYDILAAALAEAKMTLRKFEYPPEHRVTVAEARVEQLEAALRAIKERGDTDDSAKAMYAIARSALETFAESKQPDEYAAHSPECYLRKYREGYCDCELPRETV